MHGEWRKKAIKSFKPAIIDQCTPCMQQVANEIAIGAKFAIGPLLSAEERKVSLKSASHH